MISSTPLPPARFLVSRNQTHRSTEVEGEKVVTHYKARATTIYAGEPDVEYSKRLYFSTSASNNYDCRVNLGVGGDYLLALFYRNSSDSASDTEYSGQGGALTMNACDLHKSWHSVSDEEKEELAQLLQGSAADDDDDDSYKG